MTTDREEQEERHQTLLNDARVARERSASILSQFAESEANEPRGRFSTVEKASVVGVSPPSYPPMPDNNPWRNDPVGPEPPLGIDINQMPPTGEVFEIEQSIAAQDAPTLEQPPPFSSAQGNSDDPVAAPPNNPLVGVERAGSSPFLKGEE